MNKVFLYHFSYRNQDYENITAYEVRPPKFGASGWFITIQTDEVNDNKPFRAKLRDPEKDFKYLEQENNEHTKESSVESETDEEIIARLRENFEVYLDLIDGISNDKIRALIVSGAPGIGKTETLKLRLEENDLEEDSDYTVQRGNIVSAYQLYNILYENSDSKNIVVLDDCDYILKDSNALNILKAALESGSRQRKISYKSRTLENEGIPTEFIYEGRCVFVTNEDFYKHVEKERGNYAKHLAALIDRSLYLDLMLRSSREVYCRIKQMVFDHGMLDDHPVSKDYYNDILDWIYENRDIVASLSLRTPRHIGDIIQTNPEKWRKVASTVLTRGKAKVY